MRNPRLRPIPEIEPVSGKVAPAIADCRGRAASGGTCEWPRLISPGRVALALLVTVLFVLAGLPAAQAQVAGPLEGTFIVDRSASDDIGAAIDSALADLGFLHRRFARGHLEQANRPYGTITIKQTDETISIAMDDGDPIHVPATGVPIEWTTRIGERKRARMIREKGVLRLTSTGRDGEREEAFRAGSDGRSLVVEVEMRMDRLPAAIRYELVYRHHADGHQ